MRHTDLSRNDSEWEYQDDPDYSRHLWAMVISGMLLGMVPAALSILFADKIDAFMNTKAGALTAIAIVGGIGTAWFVWRIKKML